MIKQFTHVVTSFLVKEKIIERENLEVYQFGIERLLKNVLVVFIICSMAIVFKTWIATLFFFFGFIPLRRSAGGYHANTPVKCNLLTIFIYSVNIIFIYKMYSLLTYPLICFICFMSIIFIFRFAPVDHKNFIFDSTRTIKARKMSRITIIFLTSLSCIFMFKGANLISLSITMGSFTASVSVVIGSIKRRREKDE